MDIAIYRCDSRGEVRVASPRSAIYDLGAYTSLEKGGGVVPQTNGIHSWKRHAAPWRRPAGRPYKGPFFTVMPGGARDRRPRVAPTKVGRHLHMSPTLTTMITIQDGGHI